jgi:hypothetical protein
MTMYSQRIAVDPAGSHYVRMEIRDAVPEDASAACQVLRQSIAELCVADHGNDPAILTRWLSNKTPEIVASWIAKPDNSLLVLAIGLLHDALTFNLALAGLLMGFGLWMHLVERHDHEHEHEAFSHEHSHRHDRHHQHAHEGPMTEPHSHWHRHAPLRHTHPHYPDLHHRHRHS